MGRQDQCVECGSGLAGDTICPRCGNDHQREIPPADVLAAEVRHALRTLAEAFTMQAAPAGGGFTCTEADALDALYRAVGLDDEADVIAQAHAAACIDEHGRREAVR